VVASKKLLHGLLLLLMSLELLARSLWSWCRQRSIQPITQTAHTAGKNSISSRRRRLHPCRSVPSLHGRCVELRRPPPKVLLLGHVLVEHFIRLTLTRKGNACLLQRSKLMLCWFRNARQRRDSRRLREYRPSCNCFRRPGTCKAVSADLPFRSGGGGVYASRPS
jgi:hypothetical protein